MASVLLNMVNRFQMGGVDQRVQLANMVKHNFEHKIPDDLKEIYMSCYEKTLENLDNPKIRCLQRDWQRDLLYSIYLMTKQCVRMLVSNPLMGILL